MASSCDDPRCGIDTAAAAAVAASGVLQSPFGMTVGLVAAIATVLVVVAAAVVVVGNRSNRFWCPLSSSSSSQQQPRKTSRERSLSTPSVPFIAIHDATTTTTKKTTTTTTNLLRSVLQDYRNEGSQALAGLSKMLEEALFSEEETMGAACFNNNNNNNQLLLSTKIENRIHQTAARLEHNEQLLEEVLLDENFSYVLALPETTTTDPRSSSAATTISTDTAAVFPTTTTTQARSFTAANKPRTNTQQQQSYDSATQILAHLVRDWTVDGRAIRESLYDWCVEQVVQQLSSSSSKQKQIQQQQQATILVPGAGMGRLAYDLYQHGYHVEANEVSWSMAVAASFVLKQTTKPSNSSSNSSNSNDFFYPYILDAMANEVDSSRRFARVAFPDVDAPLLGGSSSISSSTAGGGTSGGSLSYTVGDFVGRHDDYYRKEKRGHFDVVVTCFFIDTATNIYEYLETIRNLLRTRGGVWINVGPVQWHHNALLRPSVDELRDLLQACGWSLKVWSIDTQPISYRNENNNNNNNNNENRNDNLPPRATNYDGYRPLRFVAIRNS